MYWYSVFCEVLFRTENDRAVVFLFGRPGSLRSPSGYALYSLRSCSLLSLPRPSLGGGVGIPILSRGWTHKKHTASSSAAYLPSGSIFQPACRGWPYHAALPHIACGVIEIRSLREHVHDEPPPPCEFRREEIGWSERAIQKTGTLQPHWSLHRSLRAPSLSDGIGWPQGRWWESGWGQRESARCLRRCTWSPTTKRWPR